MRKYVILVLLFFLFANPCFAQPDKEVYFWLDAQMGAAYENGHLVRSFRIISGYDGVVTTPHGRQVIKSTPKGNRSVLRKSANYVNHAGIPMPYALFFTGSCAIHAWAWDEPLPDVDLARYYSSSGCISLNLPDAKWLFDWAEVGTPVYIWGERK